MGFLKSRLWIESNALLSSQSLPYPQKCKTYIQIIPKFTFSVVSYFLFDTGVTIWLLATSNCVSIWPPHIQNVLNHIYDFSSPLMHTTLLYSPSVHNINESHNIHPTQFQELETYKLFWLLFLSCTQIQSFIQQILIVCVLSARPWAKC